MKLPGILILLLLCSLLTCCAKPADRKSTEATADTAAAEPDKADTEALIEAAEAGIKQLIIIYTGETLSAAQPPSGFDPPQGGLPALANGIAEYQRSIVYFNQLRVSDAGGDPSQIRADRENGMLGEHPYLLLDYGGWERPNDFAGAPLVGLFLTFTRDFGYRAVGSMQYPRLAPERWEDYRSVDPGIALLVSAGAAQGEPLPVVEQLVREVHGDLWCVVAVPLPQVEDDPFVRIRQYVDEAWDIVQASGAKYSILLCAGGPADLYSEVKADGRFTVVIGAPAKRAVDPGYGSIDLESSLLLPVVNPNGRQFGVCHLQYGADGATPSIYHLLLNDCIEDPAQPYPYRRQAGQAQAEHDQLVEEQQSAAKIGNQ